ncbi:MAG: hypothetical protein HDR88_10540 [Bacteroides sp.]|nr:hypothetical protein [Bacteroides sp.]
MRMIELNLNPGESGEWKLKRFTITPQGAKMHNLGEIFNGRSRFILPGEYWGLYRSGKVIMSNTPSEIDDHWKFIQKASGKVLVGGLGLGMVLKCLLDKTSVTKVTVVEKSSDVINLVASSYTNDPRVEIVNADIFEYKPTERYDCAWFDIWDDISGEEYPEMKKLHRRYAHYVGWSDSWLRKNSRRLYQENTKYETQCAPLGGMF